MALPKNLEELLKHMDPAVAAVQRKLWEDNPAIAKAIDEGTVPQAEFNRQLNVKDEEVKRHKKTADEWSEWAKTNKPKHEQLLSDYEKAQADLKVLQEKVKETASGEHTGVEVDAAELEKKVLERVAGKTVTEERLTQIVGEESKKLLDKVTETMNGARKDFLERTFPLATNFQAELLEVMQDYKDEFGKKIDRAEFSKFMQDNQIVSPRKAFEQFTAKDREEKRIKVEVDKRVNDELSKRNIPGVSSTTSPTDLGPLQLKIAGQTPTYPEGSELGDLSAAALASKELRAEGKTA